MQHFLQSLRVGDRLVREKGILTKHHGIFVGFHHGNYLVAENNTPDGVRYVTYDTFLNGNALTRVEYFNGTEEQRNRIIPFINSILGTNYDLVTYNCEHFANQIQKGQPHSNQVSNAVGLGIFGLLFLGIVGIAAAESN